MTKKILILFYSLFCLMTAIVFIFDIFEASNDPQKYYFSSSSGWIWYRSLLSYCVFSVVLIIWLLTSSVFAIQYWLCKNKKRYTYLIISHLALTLVYLYIINYIYEAQ